MTRLLGVLFSIEADFIIDKLTQKRGLEMMLSENSERCIMVAEAEQQVVGMCSVQTLVSTAEGGIVALIEDLVVEEDWRGRGIGKGLLESVEAWASARGVSRIQLLADRNNTSALGFYQKMNWKCTELVCLRKGRLV
ncbi:GNAT family N-acetyltransferase [Desulfosporosinus sp. SB140]|uniref:GNAT family N-acetyltransferase n=1 Tax=Desulfosporosinus paludis TaxID=3115649 RepID=UPI00388FA65B